MSHFVHEPISGDFVLAGSWVGTTDLGFGPVESYPSSSSPFVVRYRADGTPVWHDERPTSSQDYVVALAASSDGEVAAVVSIDSPATDFEVVRYASDGEVRLRQTIGGPGVTGVRAAAYSPGGGLVTVGWFDVETSVGGPVLEASEGSRDAFVAQHGATGEYVWSYALGWRGMEAATSVAVGPDGRVAFTGGFTDSTHLAGEYFTNFGSSDVFLVSLAP